MEKWYYIYLGVEWSIRLLLSALVILRQSRPATALAWLALTMMVPIPSVFLYFMFGEVRLGSSGGEMYHPEYKITRAGEPLPEATLTPLYPATDGLQQPKIRQLVSQALALLASALFEGWQATPLALAGMALCLLSVWVAQRQKH